MVRRVALSQGRLCEYHAGVLRDRLISSLIMIGLVAAVFYLDDRLDRIEVSGTPLQALSWGGAQLPAGVMLWGLFTVLVVPAAYELNRIFRAAGIDSESWIMALGAAGSCGMIYLMPHEADPQHAVVVVATAVALWFVAAMVWHSRGGRVRGATAAAGGTLLGVAYLGLVPAFYLAIRKCHSAWVVAAIILVIKSCDIGAYCVGRVAGRHKLVPWLSPGKTWEGLAGGVVMSSAVCCLFVAVGHHLQQTGQWSIHSGHTAVLDARPYSVWLAAGAGAVLGLVGHLGDLVVSLFKRDAGVKDSGRTVPGFGGILDVIDSPLLAAPVAYWMLRSGAII